MAITDQEIAELKQLAKKVREDIIDVTGWSGGTHIGGSLSMVEIVTILYWKYLRVQPHNPAWEDRDRFVLSKGHGGVGHAVVLALKGYFPPEQLKDFNKSGSAFGMHLDCHKVPGVDCSTGSMGHGLPMAVGLALGSRLLKKEWRTYCLMGDGECDEGSIWEAAMSAAHYKLDNLIGFVDRNGLMIDGPTEKVMSLEPFVDKWTAFGWKALPVDGHDFRQLAQAIDFAHEHKGQPVVIVAKTVKGKGVEFMENKAAWHYGGLNAELVDKAKRGLGDAS